MTELTTTVSGLIVPTSVLEQQKEESKKTEVRTSEVNPFDVLFPNEETATNYLNRCVVRWSYFLGVENRAKADEDDRWCVYSRKGSGTVHDTQSVAFKNSSEDTYLSKSAYVDKHDIYYVIKKNMQSQ